jgi:hypothetical protein
MIRGQKVVCINDKASPQIKSLYSAWIIKGTTYVVRDVFLGQNANGEWGEVGITLLGLVNPTQTVPPYQELGFNSERFRPIEEKTVTDSVEEEAERHASR